MLLADLGTRLPAAPAASVFFVGQLGKYVLGSVWTVLAQAEMGGRLRIPRRRRVAVVGLLSIGLAVLTGSVIGIPAIPRLLAREESAFSWWWVVLALVLGAVLLWPRLLNAAIARGLRLLRRELLEHERPGARSCRPACGRRGVGVDRTPRPSSSPGAWPGRVDRATSSSRASVVRARVGRRDVQRVRPGGSGVRDGLLAVILVTLMPLSAATAVVVVARFLAILTDLLVVPRVDVGRRHHLLGSAASDTGDLPATATAAAWPTAGSSSTTRRRWPRCSTRRRAGRRPPRSSPS